MSGPECSVTAGQYWARPLFPGLWELESGGQGSSSQADPDQDGGGSPRVPPPPPLVTGRVPTQVQVHGVGRQGDLWVGGGGSGDYQGRGDTLKAELEDRGPGEQAGG